jgi:hypothetical protein
MKDFDIEFTYTANGIMTVKAKSAEDAAALAEAILKNGLPLNQDVSYTESKGEVDFISEIEGTDNA